MILRIRSEEEARDLNGYPTDDDFDDMEDDSEMDMEESDLDDEDPFEESADDQD